MITTMHSDQNASPPRADGDQLTFAALRDEWKDRATREILH